MKMVKLKDWTLSISYLLHDYFLIVTGSKDTEVEENRKIEQVKLTHKDKKKMKKQMQYEKQLDSLSKKGTTNDDLGNQFTVSQADKSAPKQLQMENAIDIKVDNFSISARGKDLFVNASLAITAGRRYGLVGPNGSVKIFELF